MSLPVTSPVSAACAPARGHRLAWWALALWLAYSAAALGWWVAQDPARLQVLCATRDS